MNKQDFYRQYDMHVRPSNRKLRRIPNMWQHTNSWNITVSDSAAYQYQTMPIEEVDCVDILMPTDRLEQIIDYIDHVEKTVEKHDSDRRLIAQFERDRIVRLKNPTVEKAYQKYVMLLELARK